MDGWLANPAFLVALCVVQLARLRTIAERDAKHERRAAVMDSLARAFHAGRSIVG